MLRRALNLALRWELFAGRNPAQSPGMLREDPRKLFLTEGQLRALMAALAAAPDPAAASAIALLALTGNAVRPQFHALAYNLANLRRTLALSDEVKPWRMTTRRNRLVKIGARIVRHGRSTVFQMAEVMSPRALFHIILTATAADRPITLSMRTPSARSQGTGDPPGDCSVQNSVKSRSDCLPRWPGGRPSGELT